MESLISLANGELASLSTAGRPLAEQELLDLQAAGCRARDWGHVRVFGDKFDAQYCQRCRFEGPVLLGLSGLELSVPGFTDTLASGCYDSTLAHVVLHGGALVTNCDLVSRCVISSGAALVGCGCVGGSSAGGTCFANGTQIAVGPEIGGREVTSYAEMTMSEAVAAAVDRRSGGAASELPKIAERFAEKVHCSGMVVCAGARVLRCSRVVDCFLGPGAVIEASEVVQSTLLSTWDEPTSVLSGSVVRSSLVQRGCRIDGARVENSLLMEHSTAGGNAAVVSCIIGPDSGVQAGEAHHSLLGPFVGFHHQSLLIAAVWPGGRGNLGYGANVGANHTGRAPDQEIWPGEGQFFGLGCVVKFPCNFSESPYSIVAAGATCPPQRVAFPFSLIAPPEGVTANREGEVAAAAPLGCNHLWPGWVLSRSMYTVARAGAKYASRTTAKNTRVDWPIFRRHTVRLMMDARDRLRAAMALGSAESSNFYTAKTLGGLGSNFATARAVTEGEKTYTMHIRRYALRAMLSRLESEANDEDVDGGSKSDTLDLLGIVEGLGPEISAREEDGTSSEALARPSAEAGALAALFDPLSTAAAAAAEADAEWAYQRALLQLEYGIGSTEGDMKGPVAKALRDAAAYEVNVAAAVFNSKERDGVRGCEIIPGYADAHGSADDDKVVRAALIEAERVQNLAHSLLWRL